MSRGGLVTRRQAIQTVSDKKIAILLIVIAVCLSVFLYIFHPILLPFIVSLAFAYALHPIASFLVSKGLNRAVATSVMVASVILFIATILFFTIPFLTKELHSLATTLPQFINSLITNTMDKVQPWINTLNLDFAQDIQAALKENLSKILNWVFNFLAGIFTNTLAIANMVSLIILTPVLIFYMLRDWPKILQFTQSLLPHTMKSTTTKLGDQINEVLSGYFRGQASVCIVLSVYYVICLTVLGLDYSFTIGLVSGMLAFIPYLGFFIGFVAAIGVSLAQFDGITYMLIVIGIYTAGQVIESIFLTPNLVGDRIGLHPVWVIFALLAGGFILGFTGLLIAVPVAATLAVILRFAINKYQEVLKSYEDKPKRILKKKEAKS